MEKRYKIIVSASEVGNYVFCKRAWWLKLHGYTADTPGLELGTIKHDLLVRQAFISRKLFIFGFVLLIIGIIMLVIFLISQMPA